jgi:antirestriction protein ArdC
MATSVYETVTDRIIATLETGTIPWRKEWKVSGSQGGGCLPYNLQSGKPYRGINVLTLLCSGYASNGWATYKQAQALGYQVRKGEKSSPVVFWKFFPKAEDRPPFARCYSVFNVAQLDGVADALPFTPEPFDGIASAQAVADTYMTSDSHPTLAHGGPSAYFSPSHDAVQMPVAQSFTSPEAYYSTLFHEFVHSTGIGSRLNREDLKGIQKFGDCDYSKEELTAEFGAAFLCAESGISNEQLLTNSAAYIQGWVSKLKSDKTLLMRAASQAQRAADYILNRSAFVEAEETTDATE